MSYISIKEKAKNNFRKISDYCEKKNVIGNLIVRILISWAFLGVIQNLFAGENKFYSSEFFQDNGLFKCDIWTSLY